MQETKFTSTNGRWGIVLLHENPLPAQGELLRLGTAEGHEVYKLSPADSGIWFTLIGGEVNPIHNAELVAEKSLQSHRTASLLALKPGAVIEVFGYKSRSSDYLVFEDNELRHASILELYERGILGQNPEKVTLGDLK